MSATARWLVVLNVLVSVAGLGVAVPAAAGQAGAQPAPVTAPVLGSQIDPIAEAYNQFLLAQRFEAEDNVTEAIAAYKRAMTLDPKSGAVAAELAGLYMRQERTADAMATAEQALKIDPDSAQAHRVLGTLYTALASQAEGDRAQREAMRENVSKAIEHLEASMAPPTIADVNTRAMLSRLYVNDGQYDKAIAMLLDLVKDEPGWQDGALLLVQAYTAAGRDAEAQAFLEAASADNPRMYQQLAEFYGRRNQWLEASEAYGRALQATPRNNFDLKVGYASSLLNVGGVGNAMKARDLLREALLTRVTDQRAIYLLAEAERLAGDLDASEATARHLIEINRNSTRGYVALAETLEERQRYQAVVDVLAPVIESFRSSSASSSAALGALLPHLGFALQELGKTDNAVAVFEEALKLSPDDPGALRQLAEAQLAAKNYTAAAATAHSARAARPDDLRLARLEAQALRQSGKVEEGLALLQQMVQQHDDEPAAYIVLAQGYSDANRGAQAVQLLRDAQAKFPGDSTIMFELGAEFDRQKRFSDAEAAFRQLIAQEPENSAALNYLGYLLADRGERLDESVSLVQRALKVEPENGSYLDSLGWAYYKSGKLDLAEEPLRRAADRMQTNSVIQDHYGDLLLKLGRYDEAISAWNRALSGQGNAIDRDDIDKKIKSARQKLPKK